MGSFFFLVSVKVRPVNDDVVAQALNAVLPKLAQGDLSEESEDELASRMERLLRRNGIVGIKQSIVALEDITVETDRFDSSATNSAPS